MRTLTSTAAVTIGMFSFLTVNCAYAQETGTVNSHELNMKAYQDLLKMDVNQQRESIVTTMMDLNAGDAQKFWPIYHQYDAERAKIDKARADLVSEYAKEYPNISNDQANHVLTKSLELDEQRAKLKKKYYESMKNSLSAATAAKFFEVEDQLENVADLQMSANLPVGK